MNYMSIPQLAHRLDLSSATVRKYIKLFKEYFREKKVAGVKKYPGGEAAEILKCINLLTQNRKSVAEIHKALKTEYRSLTENHPKETGKTMKNKTDSAMNKKQFEPDNLILTRKLNSVFSDNDISSLLLDLKKLIEGVALERKRISDELSEIRKMIMDLEKKVASVSLRPSGKGIVVEINAPATVSEDNELSVTAQKGALADNENTADNTPEAGINDRYGDAYRTAVLKKIHSLRKNEGLTYSGIASHLNEAGLSTFSGRGKWTTGQIGRILTSGVL